MLMRLAVFGALWLGVVLSHPAQAAENNSLLREGVAAFNQAIASWDESDFNRASEIFKQAAAEEPKNHLPFYWQGATAFQFATYYLYGRPRDRNPKQAQRKVETGLSALDTALRLNPKDSESYALRGVLRGLKIQFDFWSMFALGPGVQSDRNQALKFNPDNPRVHYLTGVSFWFSPKILGEHGRALDHLLKAENLFAAEAVRPRLPLQPTWGYAPCLVFIGDIYAAQKNTGRAQAYYRKALQIHPGDELAKLQLNKLEKQ